MARFEVLEYLGEGKQGRVDKVRHRKSGYQFAMKTLEGASPTVRRQYSRSPGGGGAQSEVAILRKLRHRNVVQLVDVIDCPSDNTLRLILEYVPGGCIKQLSDEQVSKHGLAWRLLFH
jgi:serine/threonine protein kinase